MCYRRTNEPVRGADVKFRGQMVTLEGLVAVTKKGHRVVGPVKLASYSYGILVNQLHVEQVL